MKSVKFLFFSVGRIKKGWEKPEGLKTCAININKDSNQKQTWSVTLVDGLSSKCRQTRTLQLIRMQTWVSQVLEGVAGSVQTDEAMSTGRGSREEQSRIEKGIKPGWWNFDQKWSVCLSGWALHLITTVCPVFSYLLIKAFLNSLPA